MVGKADPLPEAEHLINLALLARSGFKMEEIMKLPPAVAEAFIVMERLREQAEWKWKTNLIKAVMAGKR